MASSLCLLINIWLHRRYIIDDVFMELHYACTVSGPYSDMIFKRWRTLKCYVHRDRTLASVSLALSLLEISSFYRYHHVMTSSSS